MKSKVIALGLFLFLFTAFSQAEGAPEFKGDMKLACEAVLCLSSSVGFNEIECSPSLDRYFGINEKFWSDTVRARKDFLNICPDSKSEGMPELVNAIANGSGRCDAAHLNKVLYEEKEVERCSGSNKDPSCWSETYYRIKNELPNYCRAYVNHEWTDINSTLSYQGSSEWVKKNSVSGWNKQGGKWVD